MIRELWKGIVVLTADDGAFITDGETFTTKAYLGKNYDESAWRDATAEEYEEWQRQQEEPEPTAEEATPAWDISQGEYIPEGFLLARDGVTYECIVGHYAAWNKQPPHDEYWRTI